LCPSVQFFGGGFEPHSPYNASPSLSRLRTAVEALGGEFEVGVRIDGVLF
jgi:hypothetical protein